MERWVQYDTIYIKFKSSQDSIMIKFKVVLENDKVKILTSSGEGEEWNQLWHIVCFTFISDVFFLKKIRSK